MRNTCYFLQDAYYFASPLPAIFLQTKQENIQLKKYLYIYSAF